MEAKQKLKKKKVISRRRYLRTEWSDDKIRQLINNVESRSTLWEVGGSSYHPLRPYTWQEVAAELGNGFDARECKLKWQNLRVTYKTNIASLAKMKYDPMSVPKVKWRFFDSMQFLTRNEQQEGVDNISNPSGVKEVYEPLDTELRNPSCLTTTSLQNLDEQRRRVRIRVLKGWWPDEKVRELINSVQLRPTLWKAGVIKHRKTRLQIWREVANELGKGFDARECKLKWQNLRVTYKTNIAILERNKFKQRGTCEFSEVKWRFFEAMQFISNNEDAVDDTSDFNKLESNGTSNFYTELTNSSYLTTTSQQNLDNSDSASFVVKEESPILTETLFDTNLLHSTNISKQNLDFSQCNTFEVKQEIPIPVGIETPFDEELTNALCSTTTSQPTVVYSQNKEDDQENPTNMETKHDTEMMIRASCSSITSEPDNSQCSSLGGKQENLSKIQTTLHTQSANAYSPRTVRSSENVNYSNDSTLLDKQETTRTIQIPRLAPYIAKTSRIKNDEHACFGNFIASELRSLPPEHSFALKRRLNRTLLEYWDIMEAHAQTEAAKLPKTEVSEKMP